MVTQYQCAALYYKDLEQALFWMEKALANGVEDTEKLYDDLLARKNLPLGKAAYKAGNYSEALALFASAAKCGYYDAAFWFRRWLCNISPGDSVWFGMFPQKGAYFGDEDFSDLFQFEPVAWDVLDVQSDRVLLLCRTGLVYSENNPDGLTALKEFGSLFTDAEKILVRKDPLSLSSQEFRQYIKNDKIASPDVSATIYARSYEAQKRHGLDVYYSIQDHCLRIGVELENSYGKLSDLSARDLQEWANALASENSAWWLSNSYVEPGEAVNHIPINHSYGLGVVIRPAVWIGLNAEDGKDENDS